MISVHVDVSLRALLSELSRLQLKVQYKGLKRRSPYLAATNRSKNCPRATVATLRTVVIQVKPVAMKLGGQKSLRGQEPFAVILTCADSRVIPEVIFNKGIGDLFVIRVAGNFVTSRCFGVLGSIEYAVEFLHAPLVMVLGHERCGAVKAAFNLVKKNQRPPGHIGIIADEIRPALKDIEGLPGDELHNAVLANVKLNVGRLTEFSSVVKKHVDNKTTRIVGADYDLDSGVVSLLSDTKVKAH